MGSGSKSGGGGGAPGTMPPETRKMVQSMKEIVSNFPENEIYAVLKECNMDPDAAVQRLLSLDTFHEVKSKRERRKETKETQDTRSRGNNTGSNHGVKGANEHNLRRNATMLTVPNDYGNGAYKRENGAVSPTLYSSSSSASHTTGKALNQQPSSHGYSFGADDGSHSTGTVDAMSSSVQHQPVQSAWSGPTTRVVSMADIVKMGGSYNKVSLQSTGTLHDVKAHHISALSQPDPSFPNLPHEPRSVNESSNDKHIHYDEWPSIEQPATTTTGSSALDVSAVHDANIYLNQGNISRNCLSRGVVSNGGGAREDLRLDSTKSDFAHNLMNGPATTSHHDNSTIKDINSKHELLQGNGSGTPSQSRSKAGDNIITVSSAAEELEHLSLGKEDNVKSQTSDNCTIIFPNNLQAMAGDCSFLSFGTYKSSNDTAFSDLQKRNMEEVTSTMDGHLDTRYFGYNADSPTGSYKATSDAMICDLPASTRPELMKERETTFEATYGREYMSPFSVPNSNFDNTRQSSALPFLKADVTVGNQPSLSNEVLGYSNPMQTDLLASTVETLRGSDDLQLAYFASQLSPSRYNGAVSSIGNPTTSIPEVAKSGTFLPQLSSQTLPGAVGPGLQQHLTSHQYPQSSLDVEQLAKLIGYQSQHNTYAHEPYQGGSSYQSLADVKHVPQQYNSGASLSNFPLTNANGSAGYASFGNSTNIPGSFMHNPSVASPATNRDNYDLFLSQYKDANHFNPTLRQNDSSTWDYAAGSRPMSSVPSSAYYNQAHNQHHLGYMENQQSQHYGALGYLNSHRSQTAMPRSLDDSTLDSQIPLSKQQQLWQQRY